MEKINNKKRLSLYQKSIIVFALVLLVLGEFALIYVNKTLKAYEKGDADGFLTALMKDMKKASKKGNINKYFDLPNISSSYEDKPNFKEGYKELFENAEFSYKMTEENTYELYADDNLFALVKLDDSKKEHKLGLLSYINYSIDTLTSYNSEGLFTTDIYALSTYNVKINGKDAKKEDIVDTNAIKEYADVEGLVDIPVLNHYKITGLTRKPDIKVYDNDGKSISLNYIDGAYNASEYYHTDDIDDAFNHLANKDFDPMKIAKNWSLFLTADLEGYRYGFGTLVPNLIEGTTMYKKAYAWASNIDIQFTSIHTLDKEAFTNEKISNFTVYNASAFSCEIYFEKNMTLSDKQKKTDKLHEIFYFVYYDGAYRLVNMRSSNE